jgi:hypothetical protein
LITNNIVILMAAAIIGVISPSGNEIGPFLSVEQAGLSQLVPDKLRTKTFAWYNLTLAHSPLQAVRWQAAGWRRYYNQRLDCFGCLSLYSDWGTPWAAVCLLTILFLSVSPSH